MLPPLRSSRWGFAVLFVAACGGRSSLELTEYGSGAASLGGATATDPSTSTNRIAASITAGGWHTCAILNGGTIRCWGGNEHGELGNDDTMSSPQPVAVVGIMDAVAAAAGFDHTCSVLSGGTVQCWGYNSFGQLGNGNVTHSLAPVTVIGLSDVLTVAASYEHSCALLRGGTVQCWGYNESGQLGNGTTDHSSVPVPALGITAAQ